MTDVSSLVQRIQQEFAASQEKLKAFQQQQVEIHHAKQQRQAQLEQTFDQLRDIWRPRLEALAKEFGARVQVTPDVSPGRRRATMQFKSPLAVIRLEFAATSDLDVTKLVLTYNLEILPILMQFDRHAELEVPLDQVDPEVIGQWLDDRIVAFVRTYLSLHENEWYLKDQMVEDCVAQIRFPKLAAATTRERGGKTLYFISEETAAEFDQQQK